MLKKENGIFSLPRFAQVEKEVPRLEEKAEYLFFH